MRATIVVLLFGVLTAASAPVLADDPVPSLDGDQTHAKGATSPGLSFTVLGGVAVPTCFTSSDQCGGDLGVGPSVSALALYAANDAWAFGVAAQVARIHWNDPYLGMVDGQVHYLDSDLTTGFVAAAGRFVPMPAARISPVVQLALGSGFQAQTGNNSHCNSGFIPTAQLGVGGRARIASPVSIYALATATGGVKPSACGVSDGPAATPFAGWGLGLHAGASFDVGL